MQQHYHSVLLCNVCGDLLTECSLKFTALMPTVIILNPSMTECSAPVQNIHSESKHWVLKLGSPLH